MDSIPFGVFFIGTVVAVILSIEAGYRLGQRAHRQSEDEKESPVSAMAGAILGLGAFMLAFTFGIVADRYDARKGLVRDEAGAIRTAYSRADFLPESDRGEARALLRSYVHGRVESVLAKDLEQVKLSMAEAERIQRRLWDMAVANARKDMNSDVAAMYIDSLNEVTNLHAMRVAVALQSRIPTSIWIGLFAITLLGMMAVGYQTGVAGSKRSMARPILAISFALVIELIASLDRPNSGLISVTQQPLVDLRTWMDGSAAPAGQVLKPEAKGQ